MGAGSPPTHRNRPSNTPNQSAVKHGDCNSTHRRITAKTTRGVTSMKAWPHLNLTYDFQHCDANEKRTIQFALDIWQKCFPYFNPKLNARFSEVEPDFIFECNLKRTRAGKRCWHVGVTRSQMIVRLMPSPKLSVTVHEIGHVLGLRHNRNPKAVMYFHSTSIVPSPDELKQLARLYRQQIKEQIRTLTAIMKEA